MAEGIINRRRSLEMVMQAEAVSMRTQAHDLSGRINDLNAVIRAENSKVRDAVMVAARLRTDAVKQLVDSAFEQADLAPRLHIGVSPISPIEESGKWSVILSLTETRVLAVGCPADVLAEVEQNVRALKDQVVVLEVQRRALIDKANALKVDGMLELVANALPPEAIPHLDALRAMANKVLADRMLGTDAKGS